MHDNWIVYYSWIHTTHTTAAVTAIHQLFINKSIQYPKIETYCLISNKYITIGSQRPLYTVHVILVVF